MDKDIQYYVERKYNTQISDRTAEEVKIALGSAFEYRDNASIQIRGRALDSNIPVKLELTSREVCFAIRDTVYSIIHEIRSVLEVVTPEIASDILTYGITLSGGGALLHDMAGRRNYETQIPVRVAERPLDCVAIGAGVIADQLEDLKKSRRTR